ncbi:SDR family NAD(P)-dependent oxidoreductase [Prochlorococcus sp. AH-716-A09]|nr:SDR family NAD(P)-dependent oxidoreductase [Prochlorococcus sp. AH-716-A09]
MNSKYNTKIKSVFVLGSSSEIAKEICIQLANRGCQSFHLLARDLKKNNQLIKILKEKKIKNIVQDHFDLINESEIKKEVGQYDLYLVTPGFIGDTDLASIDIEELNKITKINYSGLLKWLIAIATPDRLNSASRLWIFSSVAGDIGRPSNYQYGAAKAALSCFSQGLFLRAYNKPFKVRIFKAGFIRTRMSIGKAPEILYLSPKKLAKRILENPNKRGIEYQPWWWFFVIKILKYLPYFLLARL